MKYYILNRNEDGVLERVVEPYMLNNGIFYCRKDSNGCKQLCLAENNWFYDHILGYMNKEHAALAKIMHLNERIEQLQNKIEKLRKS